MAKKVIIISDTIRNLQKERVQLLGKITLIDSKIEMLQNLCEHDWRLVATGHNSEFRVCNICKKEIEE